MFTGIIQYIGTADLGGSILTVKCENSLFKKDIKIGDSVSINGVCLTVTSIGYDSLEFFVMKETMEVTNFKNFESGNVNIERAIKNNEEFGGHIIQGHVHNTENIINIEDVSDGSKNIYISCRNIDKLKHKDSITVSGISLTIAEICSNSFRVSVIPHTLKYTILGTSKVGDIMNIEYNNLEIISDSSSDEYYMKMALDYSKKGKLTCAPNPWVGCIIVNNNEIIGKGYHLKAGTPHAEVNAINDAVSSGHEHLFPQSNVYITLEPCYKFEGKRTPPCDELLNKYKFKKIVIGILDPDPNVSGKGLESLKRFNEVSFGILKDKIEKSLRSYIHHRLTKLPYVIIKSALSMDGCTGSSQSEQNDRWITGDKAREHVHKLRSKCQAILIGCKTILADDPMLNVRLSTLPENYQQPLRVVIDPHGKIIKGNVLNQNISKTLMITSNPPNKTLEIWKSKDVKYISMKEINIKDILIELSKRNIVKCLVEGGGYTHSKFIESLEYQELYLYYGNKIIGDDGIDWISSYKNSSRYQLMDTKTFYNDFLVKYKKIDYKKDEVRINKAIEDIRNGQPVVLMDDEDRENEGDLVIGAQFMTPELCTMFIKKSTGIICVSMEEKIANKLKLPRAVQKNEDPNGTPFAVSCDHIKTKTGVSSIDRTITINSLADPNSTPHDFTRPGHIFPLIASKGGIYERQGHTEGSVELCRLANINPVAAIAELMNDDGTMMNYEDCCKFSKDYGITIITMKELINYVKEKTHNNKVVRVIASCDINIHNYGEWTLMCYNSGDIKSPHKVLIKGNIYSSESILTRVHSECFTGDTLHSMMCDCGDQLELSKKLIHDKGSGIIIFPANQEGRGIGITNKVLAYRKMRNNNKLNTYDANKLLGFDEDLRSYDCVIDILNDLGINKIDLLTSNTRKIETLNNYVSNVIPLECKSNEHNEKYLKDKKEKHPLLSKLNTVNNSFNINIPIGNNYKICLVSTIWNSDILDDFVDKIINELSNSIKNENIVKYKVPGCFELGNFVNRIIASDDFNCIVCIGSIIKGESDHYEYISQGTIASLTKLSMESKIPLINGVTNCLNIQQAIDRCSIENAISLARSALHMINM